MNFHIPVKWTEIAEVTLFYRKLSDMITLSYDLPLIFVNMNCNLSYRVG